VNATHRARTILIVHSMRQSMKGNDFGMRAIHRRSIGRAAVLLWCLFIALASLSPASVAAPTTAPGWVRGRVVSWATGQPVAGATIRLPEFGIRTTSAPDGSFRFPRPLPAGHPYRPIRAVATAPGFGAWAVRGLPLVPGDTLVLHAELRHRDWTHAVSQPGASNERSGASASGPSRLRGRSGNTCTGWDHPLVPTPTIRVFISEDRVGREYDFAFYAAHVLPSEWIPSWDADALAAGAVAVKTYAGYRAMSGNAYSSGANCGDVVDTTADQVFDPTYSLASTDQAVYVSLGSILLRNNNLFLAQYWSGSDANSDQDWKKCEYVDEGPFAGRMSQWGTQVCAEEGEVWRDIVQVFYANTTWKYLRNLLLNPAFDGGVGSTPWAFGSDTKFTLGHNQAYSGEWRAVLEPRSGGDWARMKQTVPVVGQSTSTYPTKVALRCPSASGCSVKLRINAIPVSGNTVRFTTTVRVPGNGAWHLYTFTPPAPGIAHAKVQFVVSSQQKFWADSANVKTPYGGP
jgi:hypothetical protein